MRWFPKTAAMAVAATLCTVAVGCEADDTEAELEQRQDGQDDRFVSLGKADSNGVEDRSWAAACVLNVANQATLEQLDDDMSLWRTAAKNIVAARPYDTLEQLDDVDWVGWYAFRQMKGYGVEKGFCPGLNEEYVPADEAESTAAVVEASLEHVQGEWDEGQRPALRDAHPKAHGCVRAFFEVDNDALPADMRVGIFANDGKEHPAWIRFSNGSFTPSPDTEGDIRGMAIKLMEVPGAKILEKEKDAQTQDFLLINTPVLMVRNAYDYVEFSQKAFDGNPVSFFFGLNPLEWNFRELTITLKTLAKKIASPLQSRYWSTTPYKLGDAYSVKYSARPCEGESNKRPDGAGPDYLAEVMAEQLSAGDRCFEFMVQAQIDPETMPIEDPSLEWDAEKSPYLVAGRIHVPTQRFDSPAQTDFCEHLSFNPWHSLPEHAPLGGINRVRRSVYDAISALRHDLNERPRVEPVDHTVPGE
ncbi:MAG: catalase family protein [Myxococcales bacterium]|nr:catalase family protein [Myxococcales bacterium]